jgi:cytochrome c biogenesis protein CcmG, thiol:disulfide interchange protein DsbE
MIIAQKWIIMAGLMGLLCINKGWAQTLEKDVPDVMVTDINGKIGTLKSHLNTNGPTVIDFWATWCKPCILELSNLQDIYDDLQKETGVKVVAISIDDVRSQPRVGPMVQAKGWPYTIVLDANSDAKRALNVTNVPQTFIVNASGKIVWQHSAYNPGDEEELAAEVRKLTKKN